MKIKNYVLSLLIGVALIALGMQSNVQGKSIGSALKAVHPSVAQGRGRGQAQPRGDAMGGGHIPAHFPLFALNNIMPDPLPGAPRRQIATLPTDPGIRTRPTSRRTVNGSGTIRDRMIDASTLIIRGNMDAFAAVLDPAMFSGSRAGTAIGSGLTVTFSAYSQTSLAMLIAGSGIATPS